LSGPAPDPAQGGGQAPPTADRVPIGDLIDLPRLEAARGRPLLQREVRAALPRGWVLEDDGLHARRDLRLLFREGWILLVGMALFGGLALAIFWQAFPRGWRGLASFLGLLLAVLIVGGLVAPMITRALYRGRR
jgi:hypothetical protein